MSNRKVVGTTGNGTDNAKELANYTLELELSTGTDVFVRLDNVYNHSLRSGFLVVEYDGGEQWFRASDVVRLTKGNRTLAGKSIVA